MTSKVGPNGEVVIPEELLSRAGIMPGDSVTFALTDGQVVLMPDPQTDSRALGNRFGRGGMAAGLLADRASEPR